MIITLPVVGAGKRMPHALELPTQREVLCDPDLRGHDEAHPEAGITRSLRSFLFQDQTTRLRQVLELSWVFRRRPKNRRSA